jgi:hypothetical protein
MICIDIDLEDIWYVLIDSTFISTERFHRLDMSSRDYENDLSS